MNVAVNRYREMIPVQYRIFIVTPVPLRPPLFLFFLSSDSKTFTKLKML